MSFIVTLVAAGELDPKHVAATSEYFESETGVATGAPDVLAKGKACDLPVTSRPSPAQIRAVRDMLAPDKVDVFSTPANGRRKKLLLADMESTMITGEMLDELGRELGPEAQGRISGITDRAMRGEIDFTAALHERTGLLKGMAEDVLHRVRATIRHSDGAATLVATMRAHGATCVLVSGGFMVFAAPVAAELGFNAHHANVLDVAGGQVAGTVSTPVLDKEAKLRLLHDYLAKTDLPVADSLAVGDGANDLPMLLAAGLGVGYRPKPLLQDRLENCILHGDLTAILYAQGYRYEDISHQ